MDISQTLEAKILSRKNLASIRLGISRRGGSMVLTNGCFDILHVGHVRYLQAARELGSTLAVALNSDESVRRLKGAGRPVNTAEDRAEVLAALQAVDFVTMFDEDTATEVVEQIRPEVYVKGGDYSADPSASNFPPEGTVVLAYGGNVAVIDYVEGHSTSRILNRLGRV